MDQALDTIALAVSENGSVTLTEEGARQPPIPGLRVEVVRIGMLHSVKLAIGDRLLVKSQLVDPSGDVALEMAIAGIVRFCIREHAFIRDCLGEIK